MSFPEEFTQILPILTSLTKIQPTPLPRCPPEEEGSFRKLIKLISNEVCELKRPPIQGVVPCGRCVEKDTIYSLFIVCDVFKCKIVKVKDTDVKQEFVNSLLEGLGIYASIKAKNPNAVSVSSINNVLSFLLTLVKERLT